MGFEMVSDDNDVGTCAEGGLHLPDGAYASPDYQRYADALPDRAYDLFADRVKGTATGFEIDEAFAQHLACQGCGDDLRFVAKRTGVSDALHCGLGASVNEDLAHGDDLNAGLAYSLCGAYVSAYQQLAVTA